MTTIALTAAAVAWAAQQEGATFDDVSRPPGRLSVEITSPYYDECYKRVGVSLDGIERKKDVQEYCISQGWIDVRKRGKLGVFEKDPEGRYVLERLTGAVNAYFKTNTPPARSHETQLAAISAAEAKRRRKAAKRMQEAL